MDTKARPVEGRVLIPNVSWETYERLIEEREERRNPRFYYDRGIMEITSPSKKHEQVAYIVGVFVELLAAELELDVFGAGSRRSKARPSSVAPSRTSAFISARASNSFAARTTSNPATRPPTSSSRLT